MNKILCIVVFNLVLPGVMSAAGKPQRSATLPGWNLKYKSGSLPLKKEQWLQGVFVTSAAEENETTAIVAISKDQLRSIYFDAKAEKSSDIMQRMPRSGCAYAQTRIPKNGSSPAPGVLIVRPLSPGPFSRTAERLNARYPVRFVWSDDGVEKELVFTVNYCEYASFVANLRWFAGERWPDIGRAFPR